MIPDLMLSSPIVLSVLAGLAWIGYVLVVLRGDRRG